MVKLTEDELRTLINIVAQANVPVGHQMIDQSRAKSQPETED